jgi:DNA-binding transcriptional regulator YdaS (Cro superfamily)
MQARDLQAHAALELLASGVAGVSELAKLIGCSPQRIQNWCKHGINFSRRRHDPETALNLNPMHARRRYVREQWMAALDREYEAAKRSITIDSSLSEGVRRQNLKELERVIKLARPFKLVSKTSGKRNFDAFQKREAQLKAEGEQS